MSKFIDSLKKMSEVTSQPMGFGRARTEAAKPRIRLVALLEGESASAAVAASADGAIVPVKDLNSAKSLVAGLSGKTAAPVGISIPDSAGAEQMEDSGADFVVFSPGLPVSALVDSKLGKILEIDLGISDGLLRGVNALAVDGVLVRQAAPGLSWQNLMAIQRVAASTSKPAILVIQPGMVKGDLQALWNAGIDALVLASGGGDEIKRLREIIKELKFPTPPSERSVAMVPRVSPEPEQHEDHGHDDGDEDDE
jgi:hypothetical protein